MNIKILKWIITACLYSVLVVPFLVWGKFLFPYITPKTLFFRIAIEVALFCYILLIIYRPKYRPRFSKLTWVVLVYLLIITFASIFGVNPYNSFWGNIERGEGLLTIYHLFVFFILLTNFFKTKKDWFRFFSGSIFVSLLISLYAFGQKVGVGFLLPSAGGTRLTGTIGNASFLAAYLLINIFICLFLLVNIKQKGWKMFYGSVFLFEVYILFQTETRGALLGFLGGLLLMSVLTVFFSENKKSKLYFAGLLLFLVISSFSVWFCRDQQRVTNINALRRLTTISVTDVTSQSRLLGWNAAWRGWQDRFFLGYGYENYNIAFNKYFPVLIYRDPGSQVWFDRAHNIIFDQAVSGGIFGLLSYLTILGICFWILWSLFWNSKNKHNNLRIDKQNSFLSDYNKVGFIVLISLLAAYFVQNFFVFDIMATYVLFYSILGFLSFLSMSGDEDLDTNSKKIGSQPRVFFVAILALIFIVSIYIFNLKPALANTIAVKGLSYAYANNHRDAIPEFKRSLSYNTNQAPEIRQNLSQEVIRAYQSGQFSQQENADNFQFAIEEIEKNIQAEPQNARHYLFAMTLYNAAAIFDNSLYGKVVELGQKALELSPTRPQLYHSMGQAEISRGKIKEGIECFKKAVELNPAVIESHWNLAASYIIVGEEKLAEEEFELMIDMGFDFYSLNNLSRLVKIYSGKKSFNKVAYIYEEMLKLDPNNSEIYTRLAVVYREIGEKNKARQAVQKAVELDPNLAEEAKLFLESLEKD